MDGEVADPSSWLSEVGGAIKGVVAGVVMVPIMACCLMGNEWNYVQTKKALEGGLALCQEVDAASVDAANEGKLVLIAGEAETNETLSDDEFGVEVEAMALKRTVEMFQNKEEVKTKGKGKKRKKEFHYEQVWSEKALTGFEGPNASKYRNPGMPNFSSTSWQANEAKLGAFELSKSQIGAFSLSQSILPGGGEAASASPAPSAAATKDTVCPVCKKELKSAAGVKDHIKAKHPTYKATPAASPSGGTPAGGKPGFTVTEGYYYKGTPSSPKIGDVRIKWAYAPAKAEATIVGKQTGKSIANYEINSRNVGGIQMGKKDKNAFFAQKQAENTMMLYIIRIFGTILCVVGFGLIFAPLSAVTDRIPIIGDLADLGTGCAALGLGLIVAFFAVAVGWMIARPLIGIPMVLLAVGGLVGLIVIAKNMKAGKAGAAPAAAAPAAPGAPSVPTPPMAPPAAPPAAPPVDPTAGPVDPTADVPPPPPPPAG